MMLTPPPRQHTIHDGELNKTDNDNHVAVITISQLTSLCAVSAGGV